jgi:hypothetical protein
MAPAKLFYCINRGPWSASISDLNLYSAHNLDSLRLFLRRAWACEAYSEMGSKTVKMNRGKEGSWEAIVTNRTAELLVLPRRISYEFAPIEMQSLFHEKAASVFGSKQQRMHEVGPQSVALGPAGRKLGLSRGRCLPHL